jgi:tetratricopeptide (TPR) repeat protein
MPTTLVRRAVIALALPVTIAAQEQQREPTPLQRAMREANRLDVDGKTAEARAIFQSLLDTLSKPNERAQVQRSIAMSYGFDGDCANTVKYEEMVIAYWKTRERAEPQNAFYQQGEMANEAARICIDAGDLDAAQKYYRLGSELGNKEPEPREHPRTLWDYRLAHAEARIAARRGNKAEAQRQVALARRALDSDSAMREQQERFYPYLVGYVALYTDDLAQAEKALAQAIAMRGNDRDPFMHTLLAMTYERLGQQDKATELYRKAYGLATSHNPPAAYVRRVLRPKVGN